jgi:hypothetical protein
MSDDPEVSLDGANSTEPTDKPTPHSPATSGVAPDQPVNKRLQGCPYLGIVDDPDTRYLFASPIGCCHRAKPATLVSLEQQQAFCLHQGHLNCPVFTRTEIGPLPMEMRAWPQEPRSVLWLKLFAWGLLALLVATAVFLAATWRPGARPKPEAAPLLTALMTETATSLPTATAVPPLVLLETETAVPLVTLPPTPQPPPSATATPRASATSAPTNRPTALTSPTANATATPTLAPTPTLIATPGPTATPAPVAVINVRLLNVRQGPGLEYPVLSEAPLGTAFTVIGRSFNASWWQVCCIAEEPGWLFSESVVVEGDTGDIPIVNVPPIEE